MTATTFDTLMYAKKLREAGFNEKQAEIQAEALKEIIQDNLATKKDIHELKKDIQELRVGFEHKLKELEYKLTIKMGMMLVVAVSLLTAIIKL